MSGDPEGLEREVLAAIRATGSPLAVVSRAILAGAEAGLRSALGSADPADPGYAACVGFADRLAQLLSSSTGTPSRVPPCERPSSLTGLADTFSADPQVARYLGQTSVAAETDAETWRQSWLACLRLPPRVATRWRDRLRQLQTGQTGEPCWVELPARDPGAAQVLVEPAPALGVAGLRETPDAPVNPEVTDLLGALVGEEPYHTAAVLATQVLWLAELDASVCHSLESRRKSGFHPLRDPENREDFQVDLGYRLSDLERAPRLSVRALLELRRVDEALCSVIYQPPAHPASWWARLAQHSRVMLRRYAEDLTHTGSRVQVRNLELRRFEEFGDLLGESNVPCSVPGVPDGEVLACLRVWLQADDERYPGRVVYVRNE